MLQAIALAKRFGQNEALKAISLTVQAGDIYCLLGANGAGKTTLINLFLGFLEPTSGQALLDGLDVQHHPQQVRAQLAYIPEQVMLYGPLSGIENLRYFNTLGAGAPLNDEQAQAALVAAGLPPQAGSQPVSSYSKGMRQKVGIAVASVKNAKALLLDEPTSGLDPQAANEFSALLKRSAAAGMAVLSTTHDLFHAHQTATRIGIMKRGVLMHDLAVTDLDLAQLQALYLATMQD
jgi:ABC-2 type transport system ATP-binding protein